MTSSVEECALRARSTHGVHHAIVEINIVIGVVLGEVLVARVDPLVVDAVTGLTLGLIAHVVIVVFVVAINRIFLYGRYTLYIPSETVDCRQLLPNFELYCSTLIRRIIPRISGPMTFLSGFPLSLIRLLPFLPFPPVCLRLPLPPRAVP